MAQETSRSSVERSPTFGEPPGSSIASFGPNTTSFASTFCESWEPDVSHCRICNSKFGPIKRRHHCRNCGKCICAACAPNFIQLEGQGRRKKRICTPCIGQITSGYEASLGLASYIQRAEEAEAEVLRMRPRLASSKQRAEEAEAEVRRLREGPLAQRAPDDSPMTSLTHSFGPSTECHRIHSDPDLTLHERFEEKEQELKEKKKQLKNTEEQAAQATRDLEQAREVVYRLASRVNHIGSSTQGSTTPRGGPKAEMQFSSLDHAMSIHEACCAAISESLYQKRSAEQKLGAEQKETKRTSLRLKTVEIDNLRAKEVVTDLGKRLHQLTGETVDNDLYVSDLGHALEYCESAMPKIEEVHLAAKLSAGKAAELDRRESEVDARMLESSAELDQEKLRSQETELKRKAEVLQAKEAELQHASEEHQREHEKQVQKLCERQAEVEQQERKLQERSRQVAEQLKELEVKQLEFRQVVQEQAADSNSRGGFFGSLSIRKAKPAPEDEAPEADGVDQQELPEQEPSENGDNQTHQ